MSNLSRRAEVAAVCLVIGLATLTPLGQAPPRFFWGFDWSDLLINVLLYLPLGFVLARQEMPPLSVALIAIGLSGAIELAQGLVIGGRRGSPVDVATNFLGAMAGLAGYRLVLRLQATRNRSMIAGVAALAALPVICWALSGPLLAPAPPRTPEWWGQWSHLFSQTVPFRGTIRSVTLLGHAIPDGLIEGTHALEEAASHGPLVLEVGLSSGGTSEGVTHLASVADGEGHAVIGLEQLGDNLLLSWRSRGAGLGLRSPRLVFPGLLRAAEGTMLTVHAEVSEGKAMVEVGTAATVNGQQSTGPAQRETRRLTPMAGWRNLIPTLELSGTMQRVFDLVWTLGLVAYVLVAVRVLRPRGRLTVDG